MRPHLSRKRLALALAAGLTCSAALAVNAYATSEKDGGSDRAEPSAAAPSGLNGPYLYLGWGNPPNAADLLKETGLTQLTMAFVLSDGGCSPAWDGNRPLEGGVDAQTIKSVQDAGGDITPSIGGWSGNKLGPGSAQELDRIHTEHAGEPLDDG